MALRARIELTPEGLQPSALPTELSEYLVCLTGFEPARTSPYAPQAYAYAYSATSTFLVDVRGVEPPNYMSSKPIAYANSATHPFGAPGGT